MEQTNHSQRSIEKDLFIKAPPQRVFQALTEQTELERWFAQTAEIDLHPGGALRFYWGPGVFEAGQMVALDPPQRLSYTWEAMEPSPVTITFTLTAENDGTRLRLVQTGIGEGKDWDRYYHLRNNGWNVHLTHLTTWIETGTCPSPGPISRSSS